MRPTRDRAKDNLRERLASDLGAFLKRGEVTVVRPGASAEMDEWSLEEYRARVAKERLRSRAKDRLFEKRGDGDR